MHENILKRSCRIEPIGGGDPQEMWITFFRPFPAADEKLELRAQISSPFFQQEVAVIAEHPSALSDLIDLVLAVLQNRCDEGYRIYFFNREELDVENFWRRGVNHDNILRNVILRRKYQITSKNDPEPTDLIVEVIRPYEDIADSSHLDLRLSCKHFAKSYPGVGNDDFEALDSAMKLAAIWLAHMAEEGISIYLYEPGDIDPDNMWRWLPGRKFEG